MMNKYTFKGSNSDNFRFVSLLLGSQLLNEKFLPLEAISVISTYNAEIILICNKVVHFKMPHLNLHSLPSMHGPSLLAYRPILVNAL